MARETKTGGRDATSAVIPGKAALSVGRPGLREPEGFRWVELSKVARLESGHTPSRNHPEYWDGGIPWIGLRDATGNHGQIIARTEQQVSALGVENSSTRVLPAGTVCLSRTASVGYVVQMGVPMCTSQDFVNWVCGGSLDPNYLRYLLMAEQETVRRVAYGTTHQTMYYPDAKALHVLIPAIEKQRAVAEVLGALDDKIAANERIVDSVDAYCEALFEGFPRHGVAPLSSIATVNVGSRKPGEGQLRYLDISSVGVGRYEWPSLTDWSAAPGRARRQLHPGDTVWSTVRPNRKSHALILDDEPLLIGSTGLAVITPAEAGPAFVYQSTKTTEFGSYLDGVAEGSAYPAVRAERFLDAPVPYFTGADRAEFEAIAYPARLRSHLASVETRQLSVLRDTLLPHLMSGRIAVREARKQVEEVL